ncbi:MAG: LytTR family DNA-binding domain-containing protein [Cyclobacteriaceae bacterium]
MPSDQFFRIHNSFIVALSAIDSIQKNEVHIGQAALPISDSYKKPFRDFIEKNHLQ